MENEKSELEKLIEQAREVVGPRGGVRLTWGSPPDRLTVDASGQTETGWSAALLLTSLDFVSRSRAAYATPEEALRVALADLVQRSRAIAGVAQRLVRMQTGE